MHGLPRLSFLVVLRKQKEERGRKNGRKINIFSGHINANNLHGVYGGGLLCE